MTLVLSDGTRTGSVDALARDIAQAMDREHDAVAEAHALADRVGEDALVEALRERGWDIPASRVIGSES